MTKFKAYIIAGLIAIGIGFFHTARLSMTYQDHVAMVEMEARAYEEEQEAQEEQARSNKKQYQSFSRMMIPPDSVDNDSLHYETATPESLSEDDSTPSTFTPSDRALEAKFWLDTMGSFLTTIAPFVVPFIIYRKKKEVDEEKG